MTFFADDSFYEAMERPSEVDTSAAAAGPEMTQEERERQHEEWRKELLKVS